MPRPNKKLLFLFVILALGWGITQHFSSITFEKDSLTIQSGSRMWPFEIEIAKTERQLEKGLMFRRRLPEDTGMLFEFPQPKVASMWMKNTLIPLDMLFIDAQGNILYIAQNTRPRSLATIRYDEPVAGVLELPGGTVKNRMLEIGDIVIHPFFDHTGLK
jgi:uncharacterized membrane protein (UPF0127 family)